MRIGRLRKATVDEADLERLRVFYAALGPGFPIEALSVFEGEQAAHDEDWCLRLRGRTLRCFGAEELSNDELFVMPPNWEVTRVVVRDLRGSLTKRGEVVSVTGHFYCRPHGSWGNERLPFLHLWTMCAGRALHFESFLDGVELRRKSHLEGCPAA